jgi:hypothetical protein
MGLDPRRQNTAAERARTALRSAKYHDNQAAVERAKVRSLAHIWELCPRCAMPMKDGRLQCVCVVSGIEHWA